MSCQYDHCEVDDYDEQELQIAGAISDRKRHLRLTAATGSGVHLAGCCDGATVD